MRVNECHTRPGGRCTGGGVRGGGVRVPHRRGGGVASWVIFPTLWVITPFLPNSLDKVEFILRF